MNYSFVFVDRVKAKEWVLRYPKLKSLKEIFFKAD